MKDVFIQRVRLTVIGLSVIVMFLTHSEILLAENQLVVSRYDEQFPLIIEDIVAKYLEADILHSDYIFPLFGLDSSLRGFDVRYGLRTDLTPEELGIVEEEIVEDVVEVVNPYDSLKRVGACSYNYFNSYMSYTVLSKSNVPRMDVQNRAYTDANGFRRIGDAYVVAVASRYGSVGDLLKVEFSNGNIIEAVIGDIKGGTDCLHDGKSLLEYIVDYSNFQYTTWYRDGNVTLHGVEVVGIYK